MYGRPVSDSEYIFLSVKKSGGNLKSNLGSILNNYCEKAGVQKITGRSFHGLRKAFFTESIKAGVPVDLASEMIGHQDLKEDKAYYSFDEETNAFVAGDFWCCNIQAECLLNKRSQLVILHMGLLSVFWTNTIIEDLLL